MILNPTMKSSRMQMRSLCIAAMAALALPMSAEAAVILAVDFGGGTGNVQSGFQGFTNPADGGISGTQTYSGITVTVDGGTNTSGTGSAGFLNSRDRTHAPPNAGAYSNYSLLRDRIVSTGGTQGVMLTISGLAPDTDYVLQVWGFDTRAAVTGENVGAKPGTNILWDNTAGSDYELGRYTMAAGDLPVDNNSFSITSTLTTDSSGTIVVRSYNPTSSTRIDGSGIMNGFMLSQVPEPSASLLAVAGASLFLSRRRRLA